VRYEPVRWMTMPEIKPVTASVRMVGRRRIPDRTGVDRRTDWKKSGR
jgi:hypothetical protein